MCLIDNKPAVLIADLPDAENEHFHTVKYGLYALKHTHNNGLVFRDFRVPRENLLDPEARRRVDDRLPRAQPRARGAVRQRGWHDAGHAGQHSSVGRFRRTYGRRH